MEEINKAFSENPILNSPYEYPRRHWELDSHDHPTGKVLESRRPSSNRSPIAAATAKSGKLVEQDDLFNDTIGNVDYRENDLIQSIRSAVDAWRNSPEQQWHVTAETAMLLKHWRYFDFPSYRPFFCQIEAIETLIWLVEVAPSSPIGKQFLQRLLDANTQADPDLFRIALKLATGAGKTTVMAMIIAWQTINAQRHGVSEKFTNGFLITAPGLTIRDRLQVLLPNDEESYYSKRDLVPAALLPLMNSARIAITNYHAYALKETLELSKGTKALLIGSSGIKPQTHETPGQMLRRVMPELIGLKNILMINDEAHHCYRHRPDDGTVVERKLETDEKDEAKHNEEAARLWISGLEAVRQLMPKAKVIDLSATPFFLRGSGYEEGTLFHWTVCDFSLMDALECGIVKLPRIPLDDNFVSQYELPKYRDLWKNLKETAPGFCKIRSKGAGTKYDPQKLPQLLQTAIKVLYNHYEEGFRKWPDAETGTPPCFIFVCQNTAISKLIYDYVSGYSYVDKQGITHIENAACRLFSNYDFATKEPLAVPNTLLIDSLQLESGDILSKDFREVAAKEIETYKRELIARTGDVASAENLSDSDLLREVMNTVGKEGKLGEHVRCVVSVSMLTEGWDANNVTHILGVRAFGTQLLCEQVVGRALRRINYDLDAETGLFSPEYADIFGIPFNFASGVKGGEIKPPDIVHVHAIHPERDGLEIKFPRVMGYYIDRNALGSRLKANFNENHALTIQMQDIGPTKVLSGGFVGQDAVMGIKDGHTRISEIVSKLTEHFLRKYATSSYDTADQTMLFINVRQIITQWINEGYLRCATGIPMDFVLRGQFKDVACERINNAIISYAVKQGGEEKVSALVDDYYPTGSTLSVNFRISRNSKQLYQTNDSKCHVNYAVCDSNWEALLCKVLEEHPKTLAYVKNYHLGFDVPYTINSESKNYQPDFIVLVDDGHGMPDPLHLVIEVKGYRYLDANHKKMTMETYWIPGVNKLKNYGRWAFFELNQKDFSLEDMQSEEATYLSCKQAYADNIEELLSKSSDI